jgi:hypothetical protein
MIVKGKPRSGPVQLAAYLMRSDEQATLIELWDGSDDLHKAFLEWHAVGEATRGEKTLYHAQIAPEAKYGMTPDQWKRAAQILADELGMKNHPRAIVVHAGDDRPHAHVVFQRADSDTLKLWDDSFNYVKHERASLRMAKEFGMEIVPGKHAKRDRKKQPEFPRAEMDRDEAQQAKRTGKDLKAMKAQLAALKAGSDTPQAFKAALEDAGFVLANGDRGYTVVDDKGAAYNLARQLKLKTAEVNEFMAPVPLAGLPSVEDAQARQAERRKTVSKTDAEAEPENKGVEASKFLRPQEAPKGAEPTAAPADAELEALKKAIADRHMKEAKERAELHAAELRQFQHELEVRNAAKTADFDAMQQQERDRLKAKHAEKRKGLKGVIDAVHEKLKTATAAEKAKQRRRETAQLKARQERERKEYVSVLEGQRKLEIENLKQRQALRDSEQEFKRAEEQERYIREHQEAKRIRERIEEQRRQEELERNETLRDGPPPPKLGK